MKRDKGRWLQKGKDNFKFELEFIVVSRKYYRAFIYTNTHLSGEEKRCGVIPKTAYRGDEEEGIIMNGDMLLQNDKTTLTIIQVSIHQESRYFGRA